MRALRVPLTVATCFAGSVVAMYMTVLALQFLGVRISLGSMAVGLTLIAIVAISSAWGRGAPAADFERNAARAPHPQKTIRQNGNVIVWTLPYGVFWIAVLLRAWHDPLA